MTSTPRIYFAHESERILNRLMSGPAIADNFFHGDHDEAAVQAAIDSLVGQGVVRWHEDNPAYLEATPGVDLTSDRRHWRKAEGEPGPDPLTDVEIMAAALGVPIVLPAASTLIEGRVRPDGTGRWVAETGSGSTLQTVGVCDTAADAERLVRSALAARVEAFAAEIEAWPGPFGLMGRHVRTINPQITIRSAL